MKRNAQDNLNEEQKTHRPSSIVKKRPNSDLTVANSGRFCLTVVDEDCNLEV